MAGLIAILPALAATLICLVAWALHLFVLALLGYAWQRRREGQRATWARWFDKGNQ